MELAVPFELINLHGRGVRHHQCSIGVLLNQHGQGGSAGLRQNPVNRAAFEPARSDIERTDDTQVVIGVSVERIRARARHACASVRVRRCST